MKEKLNNIHKILFLVIGILAVILAALLIHKAYELHQERLHQEQLEVRHREVQSELDDIQMQIKELSGDGEALQQFLNEKVNQPKQEGIQKQQPDHGKGTKETMSETIVIPKEPQETEKEPAEEPQEAGEEEEKLESVTANELYGDEDTIVIDIPEKAKPQEETESVSANQKNVLNQPSEAEIVSVNQTKEAESVSVNRTGDTESVSANLMSPAGNTISGNAVINGETIPFEYTQIQPSLEERRIVRTSYTETIQVNGEDKAQIAKNNIDFSDWKIACLGDSLTAGNNKNGQEGQDKYSYPAMLKNILNAETVYNLGIGGSSYGRYWDQAFVDRYKEIPEDSDIIIIMGGTNDGFAASAKELGSMNEKKPRTFYGDVDELMKGLKKDYPNAKIIFVTPLPNVLHDYLMNQRDYLLPQSVFADAVKQLAAENNIDVIDLYNSNILDTHDAQIISTYMPDGVHGNPAGYQILAEHLAGGIIRIMENDALNAATVSGNTPWGGGISGNSSYDDSVSGNTSGDDSVSGNGTEEAELPDADSVSANHAAKEEAKRKAEIEKQLKKEEELSAKELEEVKKKNEKAAEEAEIIAPVKEPEKPAPDINEEPAENYEYNGEAILIQ